jgi:transcriptional regulator NrdR family protein
MNGKAPDDRGLSCPACGCRHFFVIYTRRALGGKLMRRRECRHCGRRITTYEYALGTQRSKADG